MMAKLRLLLLPAVCTLIAGSLLIGLGVWQLHRLAWKEAIIARIEARAKAPPQALPPESRWASLKPDDYDYRRVSIEGTFRDAAPVLVFRPSEDGPGYLVMAPLGVRSGGVVLINRGFIPADLAGEAKQSATQAPKGEVRVSGLMRPPEARNLFTPADEPGKNIFFTRDPQLIATHLRLTKSAPFVIDADATPGRWPRGGATQLAIPNNHLSYALTWFGLALALFGVFATFAWRRLEPSPSETNAQTVAPLRR